MANINTKKGVIGILTGGGDVPGLNPAIRGVTLRALHEGYEVIGLRHGWAGLVEMVRDKNYDNSENFLVLNEEIVDRAGRTGGTFLHSSRTNPGRVGKSSVPAHLSGKFTAEKNDLTPEILKNLGWLGIGSGLERAKSTSIRLRSPARSTRSTRCLPLQGADVCQRPYPGPAAGGTERPSRGRAPEQATAQAGVVSM